MNQSILNPFAFLSRDGDAIEVIAPKPGASLVRTRVVAENDPDLFALLDSAGPELGQDWLNAPLAHPMATRMREMGLLVARSAAPRWPRYAAALAIGAGSGFEERRGGARAGRLRSAAVSSPLSALFEKRIYFADSPRWMVEDPVTGLRFPYWDRGVAPSRLQGSAPDRSVRAALQRAGVRPLPRAISQARSLWSESLDSAATSLRGMGYATVQGAIPAAHVRALRRYFSALVEGGFLEVEQTV